jgi:uroporphyrin-III C-methyltransferase/precorrin-2 dehydrogenase/sirohydrochlorin ferrochelatase
MTEDAEKHVTAKVAARAARIGALATLPVFFKLKGRRAIVAGGSEPGLWKAEVLAAAGAHVAVYSDSFVEGFHELAASPPAGMVELNQRGWQPGDLNGAAIAIGAITDAPEASAFAAAARTAGVPVNVIDRPEVCDFQFGAIVDRSPLIVAISTDGGAPVLGQSIRSLVEGLLPEGLAHWLDAAKAWRRQGDRLGATSAERRGFWERFTNLALREAARAPTDADLAQLLVVPDARQSGHAARGHVTIIAIGKDGTETLTLGAVRKLRGADSIFYDASVPADVFGFARREAERRLVAANEIADVIVASASEGRRVVWLKLADGSDAAVASAATAALRAADVPFEVIGSPGTG